LKIEVEITGRTKRVLCTLDKSTGKSIQTISNLARVSYDIGRGMLHALYDIGLVVKQTRRSYAWQLSKKGQELIDQTRTGEKQ